MNAFVYRTGLFFVVGSLRTGSSLLTRCIDDHPAAVCLCESEINRVLFGSYYVKLHCDRMVAHGLTLDEITALLDRKKQDDIPSLLGWYTEVAPRLSDLYGKPCLAALGDKSPDFFSTPSLVEYLAASHQLIFTVRDPRAILCSIVTQDDASPPEKEERWANLLENYGAWKPYLNAVNMLVVKYEQLVTNPEATMRAVYAHLDLPYSAHFATHFARRFPSRFLWHTAVDLNTGAHRAFDSDRIGRWRTILTDAQLSRLYSEPAVCEFMERFDYHRHPYDGRLAA